MTRPSVSHASVVTRSLRSYRLSVLACCTKKLKLSSRCVVDPYWNHISFSYVASRESYLVSIARLQLLHTDTEQSLTGRAYACIDRLLNRYASSFDDGQCQCRYHLVAPGGRFCIRLCGSLLRKGERAGDIHGKYNVTLFETRVSRCCLVPRAFSFQSIRKMLKYSLCASAAR